MAWDAYLTIEGVSGESQRTGHEGEIEILAFSFGGSNPASVGIGSGGGTGTVNLTSFSIEKYTDASSAELFQHMCAGEHFPVGKLTLYKSGGAAGALPYLTYDFEEMYVDDLQWGGAGDIPHESVSFSFGKIIITYTEQSAAGTAQGDHVGSWDVRTVSP